jgi:hypothetical protein
MKVRQWHSDMDTQPLGPTIQGPMSVRTKEEWPPA